MQFKEWLKLNESPYATVNPVIRVGDKAIEIIDLRAEDWEILPDHLEADAAREFRKSIILYGTSYPAFYGRLPNDKFLYHDKNDDFNYKIINNKPDGDIICLDDLPLKSNWWEYVQGIDGENNIIKYPQRIRNTEKITERV